MAEASKTWPGHLYPPLTMQPGVDIREGVQAWFRFFDPHRGWRRVSSRESRTRSAGAEEIRQLLDKDYPRDRKVKLGCDNLNTHHLASLYEAVPAPEAHRLARRLEIYHPPRNGSWLNVAEIELSVLSEQGLDRRIPTVEELNRAIAAWQIDRNRTASLMPESNLNTFIRYLRKRNRPKLMHLVSCVNPLVGLKIIFKSLT